MKQRIADSLQIVGAIGITTAATVANPLLGLGVGSVFALVAGIVVGST